MANAEHAPYAEQATERSEVLDSYRQLLTEVSLTCRLPWRTELTALREEGERAAEEGFGLRELVGRYLAETRRLWGTLPGVARAAAANERARTGDALLGAVESAISALGEGHERAQRLAVRQFEAERQEFVDDLLYGRSDLGRLAERAQRFGLRLARAHVVGVAEAPGRRSGYDEGHPHVRRIERELVGRYGEREVLLATKEGRMVCVASGSERGALERFAELAENPGPGYQGARRVAIGREHSGAPGVVRSYDEALVALDMANRLELEAVRLNASELMVFPVLLRDRAAMADLVRSVLGPLTEARGGAVPLLDTLSRYSESGYVNAEAARRLGVSVRTLSYRLARIRALTGYDPAESLHRFTLETAVLGARLLNWPRQSL